MHTREKRYQFTTHTMKPARAKIKHILDFESQATHTSASLFGDNQRREEFETRSVLTRVTSRSQVIYFLRRDRIQVGMIKSYVFLS